MKRLIAAFLALFLIPAVALGEVGFRSNIGSTKSVAVTATSNSETISAGWGDEIVLANEGPNAAFCNISKTATTAATSHSAVLPSSYRVYKSPCGSCAVVVSCVAKSTETATVQAERGDAN